MFKLIKLIILIVVILIALNYFGISIKGMFESDLFKGNVSYILDLLKSAFDWFKGLF